MKLSRYVRQEIPKLDQLKLAALITIEVHARDAFVQCCHNLMEGQLQFERKTTLLAKGTRAELPAFGGSRGSEIGKSFYPCSSPPARSDGPIAV
jgi:hypothetical protein